jgi:hypothetical protein
MDLTSRGQNRPAVSCENTIPTVWVPQNVGNSSTSTSVVELAPHSFSRSRDQHSIFYCLLGTPRNECRGRNSADGIVASLRTRPGLRTCGMHVQNGRRHLLLSQFSFIYLPYQRLYIVKNTCTCMHFSDCLEIVYELPLLPNDTGS